MPADDDIARLEAIAFRAWPAATAVPHRGMLLRATGGDSRRANSAALHACETGLAIDEAIDAAEDFYAQHGLPPRFQVGPLTPAGFDAALGRRGYALAAPVSVQTATLAEVTRRCEHGPTAGVRAEVLAAPDARWIDLEVSRGRYADIADTFLRSMKGLGDRAGFGVADLDDVAASACLLVHEGDVVVLSAMRTAPELRRRGAARALMSSAAAWGAARGASVAYLQVERDNTAALRLYQRLGFTPRYPYHYREKAL